MQYLRNLPTVLIALVLATQALVSSTANAQTAFKIGFVDPVRLIEQAPQGVKALANLEDEFRSRDQELKVQHDKIQKMEAFPAGGSGGL